MSLSTLDLVDHEIGLIVEEQFDDLSVPAATRLFSGIWFMAQRLGFVFFGLGFVAEGVGFQVYGLGF